MKIRRMNEKIDPDIKIKNYFEFIYSLLPPKQNEYVEFFKSLNLTDEQYLKLSDIIREYGSERFEDGQSFGPYDASY